MELVFRQQIYRAVASGGAREATPSGPVEPGKLSLWMDLFEVDFLETYLVTSAENSVSEPPNLKIF